MAKDPLFHDERLFERMAGDPQITATYRRSQWIKVAIALVALALIAAIWLTWRFG